jgi:hypothetical protein
MAFYSTAHRSVIAASVAEYAVVTRVTPEFFQVLVQPSTGRNFSREETREGASGTAMIIDRYARQQFGDPSRDRGRTLRLFNRSVPDVGVMPPAFVFPEDTEMVSVQRGARQRGATEPARQQLPRDCATAAASQPRAPCIRSWRITSRHPNFAPGS